VILRSVLSAALMLGGFGLADVARAQAAKEPAAKQKGGAIPGPMQGFSRNRKDPVKIEANALEVRDRDKTAVFMGNVVVVQGETTLRCSELKVFYEGDTLTGQTQKVAAAGTAAQRIRRLEAGGGVIITAKEQKATGDSGVYDLRANTMTLNGNVVVTQGQNVMQGDRLVVELGTGTSRLEAGGKPGPNRVKGLFVPSNTRDGGTQEPVKGPNPRN
jgi:lipopolysaccharide export system protein LptA